ncbi:hypothetical protein EON77_22250 [bacterium]|nr:MAG: hypothetical protein EON77_22250 [bacterium]
MEGDPMDFLRSQLAIVQDRLGGLTASQRLLAGALFVIVIMTMLYWGRIAGTSERVALLASPLPSEELTQLTAALKAKGIDVTVDARSTRCSRRSRPGARRASSARS